MLKCIEANCYNQLLTKVETVKSLQSFLSLDSCALEPMSKF